MPPLKILFVATSHDRFGDSDRKTGLWLEELALPYYIFKEAGALITLVTPKGGPVPVDPKSESIIVSNSTIRRFQLDAEAISLLSHSIHLETQRAEAFDLVFLLGGHGSMWDFSGKGPLKQLLEDFDRQNKLIAAVCHGAAGLLALENKWGEPLVKGRRITAFSNTEEQVWGMNEILPFSLESELVNLGASYCKNSDFVSHVVIDGNIITGQNPASSKELAKKLLICLKELPKKAEAVMG